jgi:hypothetical protein
MAGYNVQTPPLFTVRDPVTLMQSNISALQATITTPDRAVVTGSSPLTAESLLGGFVTLTDIQTYNWDSAENIVDELSRKLWRLTNDGSVKLGTTVSLVIDNTSGGQINIYDGNNSHGWIRITSGETAKATIMVLDVAALGGNHIDRVAICGCVTETD